MNAQVVSALNKLRENGGDDLAIEIENHLAKALQLVGFLDGLEEEAQFEMLNAVDANERYRAALTLHAATLLKNAVKNGGR